MTTENLSPEPAAARGQWLPATFTGISGGAGDAALAYAHQPGWLIASIAVLTPVITLLTLLIPQESKHKLDLWRLILEYRERKRSHPQSRTHPVN